MKITLSHFPLCSFLCLVCFRLRGAELAGTQHGSTAQHREAHLASGSRLGTSSMKIDR